MKDPEKRIVVEYNRDAKRSKLSILSFLLIIAIFFLDSMKWTVILLVLAAASGLVAFLKISTSGGLLKGRLLASTSIILSLIFLSICGLYYVWSFDTEPILDDYTVADLNSASPEYTESYNLLLSLADKVSADPNSSPAIGLSARDVRQIRDIFSVISKKDFSDITARLIAEADQIEMIWQKARPGREIIDKLSEFDQIADLMEPQLSGELRFGVNLRRIARLYGIYACTQTVQGNTAQAVDELIKMDSVFRKLKLNQRSILLELVCAGGLNTGIQSANFILNSPEMPDKTLSLLAGHFKPFTTEQMSMKNSFIAEYLAMKKSVDQNFQLQTWQNNPTLKRNSMLRLYKNNCDYWISVESGGSPKAPLSVWPEIYHNKLPEILITDDPEETFPWYYRYYNPVGTMLISVMKRSYNRIVEINTRLKIEDDLLQIVLNKKLGRDYSLKAREYSDEYVIDTEKKIIFSPGPDGKNFTDDDIDMKINPEVLSF